MGNSPTKLIPKPSIPLNFHSKRYLNQQARPDLVARVMSWHGSLAKTPLLFSDTRATDSIVDCYCRCGFVDDARHLLVKITHPNPVLWNLVMSGLNKTFKYRESLDTFRTMRAVGLAPNEFAYASAVSACSAMKELRLASQVHSLALKDGHLLDDYVLVGFVDLFAKNWHFNAALRLFLDVADVSNVVCWNVIIAGAVGNGEHLCALNLYLEMVHGCCHPNAFTFSSVLSACVSEMEFDVGRGIHGRIIKCGVEDDVFVGSGALELYAKCGDAEEALKQFALMPVHNVVSWTTVISGFVQKGENVCALELFIQLRNMDVEINDYTVTSVLMACGKPGMVGEALQIHCWIMKSGFSMHPSVRDALINAYGKCRNIQMSLKVFDDMGAAVNMGTWAAIISGLVESNDAPRCTEFFRSMFVKGLMPDEFCTTSILSIVDSLVLGRQIHSYLVKSGLKNDIVSCALFTMYSKCGDLINSYSIFKQMHGRDRVTWTSMIAGFAEHGYDKEAFQLFHEMMIETSRPDPSSLTAVLSACTSELSLRTGKKIHGHILRARFWSDMLLGGALISMYSKCKALDYASTVFEEMPEKDQFSWLSLISGYAQSGYSREALLKFSEMMRAEVEVDHFTLASALGACANLASLTYSNQLHAHIAKTGFSRYHSVNSALVTTYAKCGNIVDSRKTFDKTDVPDRVMWTAMIDGYAQHGDGEEALKLYNQMVDSGIPPDSVTFIGVLSACSHSGLVEEGFLHFDSMSEKYGVQPEIFHYSCMVDLLCRSGRLKEASRFIAKMPIEPNTFIWTTVLGACRLHGELELAKTAAEKIIELEPSDSGACTSLSNIFAEVGDWDEVLSIRKSMSRAATKKEAGWSSL